MGKRLWMAVLLAVCVGHAGAAGLDEVRAQIESSRLVKGTIDIAADGRVVDYALQGREALPEGVRELIAGAVPHWRFEPIELPDGTVRASMSLRLVAKKLADGGYLLAIRGAHFGSDMPAGSPRSRKRHRPRYPKEAAIAGVGGTVYAVLRIGSDGRVEDAFAEQVNLHVVASEAAMEQWRETLAKAALQALRRWTFDVPAKDPGGDPPAWLVRVPVEFVVPGYKRSRDDEWRAYIPGPRARAPWETSENDAAVDALAADDIYPVGRGPRLLTPLGG